MSWQRYAEAMTVALADSGELRDPDWRSIFADTPRHVFLPGISLDAAYADRSVVTQTRQVTIDNGTGPMLPTSSASAPSVVAVMLDRLALTDTDRVLEIGTGTGYNAALLSRRVGDTNVYSIDLDPTLVHTARDALSSLGLAPRLRAGNGELGWPDTAPFDAIVATCAIDHIPPAWIDQLTTGGRLVAPLVGDGCALIVATKTAHDELTGHIDPYQVAFMPLRDQLDNPLPAARGRPSAHTGIGQYGTTDTDPAILDQNDPDLLLLLQLHLPGLAIGSLDGPHGPALTLTTPLGFAQVSYAPTDGRWITIQHRQRLWDTAEHVTRLWDQLGKPTRDRYGLSALNRTDRQYIWLDDPDSPYAWPLAI